MNKTWPPLGAQPDTDTDNAAAANAAQPPLAAAVLNSAGLNADELLAEVVRDLKAAGCRVAGLLMTYPDGQREGCASSMVLVDQCNGDQYLVSQPMGRDSRACRADPQGFARASAVLRRALEQPPQLLVLNRFGSLEAEGGGFRAELLDLLTAGVPLLTVVSPKQLDAWRAFMGAACELPPERAAINRWLQQVLGAAWPGPAPGSAAH